MKLNPEEGPKGYVALCQTTKTGCDPRCALRPMNSGLCRGTPCGRHDREDGCTVYFVKAPKARKKPLTFAAWWKKNNARYIYKSAGNDPKTMARRAFAAGRRRRK